MKKIWLSIKEHRLTNKYNPTFRQYDYVQSFDFEDDRDIELIYEMVNLYVHTYYEYNDNIRKEAQFKAASAIFLDFDGKDGHNDSSIEEFLDSEFSRKYNWMLYTSKSHITNDQECYHVILPLDTKIKDLPTLKATYDSVFKEIKENKLKCDTSIRDSARLIFPSLNESNNDDKHFENFKFEINYDGIYLKSSEPTYSEPIIEQLESLIPILYSDESIDEEIMDYVNEFHNMSNKAKYTYFKTMMKFINIRNKRSGFTFLSYSKWIGIGYTLYKIFGELNGKRLFRVLSYGYPGDTKESIDRQFEYLSECNFSTNKNIEILIQLTISIGFKHTMYFRYYFMAKHRFNISQTSVLYERMVKVLMNDHGFYGPTTHAKLYDFSFKKNTRRFLMELRYDDEIYHISVTMSEMMNVMADILKIPRKFVTTAITRGVIRKFININGVYDITRYVKVKIMNLLNETDGEYVRVTDVNNILKEIRDYSPSTIHSLITNKNIELYFFELGIFVNKRKKRFSVDGSSKPYAGFKVDRTKIVISESVAIPKRAYYLFYEDKLKQNENIIIPQINNHVVMRC